MKRSDQSGATEEAIRRAVVQLMNDIDYDRITADAVAKQAGVSRSTFYRYFDSVVDAVETIEQEFLELVREVNRIALQCARDLSDASGLTQSMVSRMEHILQHRDFIIAVDGPHGDRTFRGRAEKVMSDYLFTRLQSDPSTFEEKSLYVEFVSAGHYRMIYRWLVDFPTVPAARVAAMTNKLLYSIFR